MIHIETVERDICTNCGKEAEKYIIVGNVEMSLCNTCRSIFSEMLNDHERKDV